MGKKRSSGFYDLKTVDCVGCIYMSDLNLSVGFCNKIKMMMQEKSVKKCIYKSKIK